MFISIVPAIESRRLLMGETVDKKTLKEIVQITEQNTSVKSDTSFFYVHVAWGNRFADQTNIYTAEVL